MIWHCGTQKWRPMNEYVPSNSVVFFAMIRHARGRGDYLLVVRRLNSIPAKIVSTYKLILQRKRIIIILALRTPLKYALNKQTTILN